MELSEEEENAIKDCDTIFMCLEDMMSEESADDYRSSYRLIKNLINNQQKEIEEKTTILLAGAEKVKQLEKEIEEKNCLIDVLQHKIEELLDNKKEINYIKPIDIPVHNYINEDKIREKIKKAKEINWHTPKLVIEYFEELLEDN